jgi:hypothetical protein
MMKLLWVASTLKLQMMTLISLNHQLVNFAVDAVAATIPNDGKDCAATTDLKKELTMNFDINYVLTATMHRNHFDRKCRNYIICK